MIFDLNKEHPLFTSAYEGDLAALEDIINIHPCFLSFKDKHHNTLLMFATTGGHLNTVQWLLDKGAAINEKNRMGTTALICAAAKGHLEITRYLVDNGASINEKENDGMSAFLHAVTSNQLETAQWLFEHGAPVNDTNIYGLSAFLLAAANGRLPIARWLLNKGISIEDKCNTGNTALFFAAFSGHFKMTQWLLDNGASIHAKNHIGMSALHLTVANKDSRTDLAHLLLEHNISIKEKDLGGNTALFYAASSGHIDNVQWLLNNGLSINEKNNSGYTAISQAILKKRPPIIQYLLSHGANFNDIAPEDLLEHKNIMMEVLRRDTTITSLGENINFFAAIEQAELLILFERNQEIIACFEQITTFLTSSSELSQEKFAKIDELSARIESLSPNAIQFEEISRQLSPPLVDFYLELGQPEDALELLQENIDSFDDSLREIKQFTIAMGFFGEALNNEKEIKKNHLEKAIQLVIALCLHSWSEEYENFICKLVTSVELVSKSMSKEISEDTAVSPTSSPQLTHSMFKKPVASQEGIHGSVSNGAHLNHF